MMTDYEYEIHVIDYGRNKTCIHTYSMGNLPSIGHKLVINYKVYYVESIVILLDSLRWNVNKNALSLETATETIDAEVYVSFLHSLLDE